VHTGFRSGPGGAWFRYCFDCAGAGWGLRFGSVRTSGSHGHTVAAEGSDLLLQELAVRTLGAFRIYGRVRRNTLGGVALRLWAA
jgi:hypothetical protein